MSSFADPHDTVSYARSQWEEGEARVTRSTEDSGRRMLLERVVDAIMYELEKRLGQTFTGMDLVREYERAEPWALEVASRIAPEDPWAWEQSVVLDAACFRMGRRTQDYQL
jgi:hypothetical protein